MPEFKRVKDKITGHEFTVLHPNLAKVTVIDKPAVGRNGRPLPAKPKTSVAEQVAAKKKTIPNGGESVNTSQEDSK